MAIYQGTNKVSGLSVNESVPVGTVVSFASNNIPNGWWICDGREVSRTDYKQLFDAIGTTWGDGNGSTTFNIPNTKDLFIQGANGNIGETIDAGLPNITGSFYGSYVTFIGEQKATGMLEIDNNYGFGLDGGGLGATHSHFNLSARKGETKTDGTLKTEDEHHVYGSSDTVQPPSVCMNYIIKYSNVLMSEVKVIDDSIVAEDKCYSSQKTVDVIDEKVKEVYSTEEKVIGTWIDGKPIYRRLVNQDFVFVSGTIGKWYGLGISVPEVDKILDYNVIGVDGNATCLKAVWSGLRKGSDNLLYAYHIAEAFTVNQFWFEYTKTTD